MERNHILLLHVFLHALVDSVKMLPFLYLAYLLIEYIERYQGQRIEKALAGGGRWGFLPGSLLGCVPQCGFSTLASGFYASRVITLGTLLAVFLATSDEAIPLMLAVPGQWPRLALLIGIKIVVAVVAGFCLDVVFTRFVPASLRGGYTGTSTEVDCHEHHEEKHNIWLAALSHTVNIFLYVLVFSFAIAFIMEWLGPDVFTGFLQRMGVLQPAVAALVGLIPNCASSVLLTQLYLSGSITFGSAVAGLCSGAGVGLMVLYKTNKNLKQNLFITALLWAIGTLAGLCVQGFGIV